MKLTVDNDGMEIGNYLNILECKSPSLSDSLCLSIFM